MKQMLVCAAVGFSGTIVEMFFGHWNESLTTLLILMVIDFCLGFSQAAFFKASTKTKSGALSSNEAFKGIVKKVAMLALVAVGFRVDVVLGTSIESIVIYGLMASELVSITENLGGMGVPIPTAIMKSIDLLKNKEG